MAKKRYHNFKSRTTGELILSVVVEFRNWQTLVMTRDTWDLNFKTYHDFLRTFEVPVGELKKIHRILLNPEDFPSPSEEWNP